MTNVDYLFVGRGELHGDGLLATLTRGGSVEVTSLPHPPRAPHRPGWVSYLSSCLDRLALGPVPSDFLEKLGGVICREAECSLDEATGVVMRDVPSGVPAEALCPTARDLLRWFAFWSGSPVRIMFWIRFGPEEPYFQVMRRGPKRRSHPRAEAFIEQFRRSGRSPSGEPLADLFLDWYASYQTAETPNLQFLALWNALEALAHYAARRNGRLPSRILTDLEQACNKVLEVHKPDEAQAYRQRLRPTLGQLAKPPILEMIASLLGDVGAQLPEDLLGGLYQMRNCVTHTGSCTRLGGSLCQHLKKPRERRYCEKVSADPLALLWEVTVKVATVVCWRIPLAALYNTDEADGT